MCGLAERDALVFESGFATNFRIRHPDYLFKAA